MNVKEWKYQYFEWGLILWKSSVKEWCKKWKSKVKSIENLIFWLWLSKCNIIWAYFHCSAVQRNPLQFLWKLLWKLATVHFSEIDSICSKVIDEFMIKIDEFLITVWEAGGGWGWFLTDNFRICCLFTANLVGWFGPKYQSVSKCENACALKIQDISFATRYLIIAYLFIASSICLKNDQPVSFAFCVRKILNREIRTHWIS